MGGVFYVYCPWLSKFAEQILCITFEVKAYDKPWAKHQNKKKPRHETIDSKMTELEHTINIPFALKGKGCNHSPFTKTCTIFAMEE